MSDTETKEQDTRTPEQKAVDLVKENVASGRITLPDQFGGDVEKWVNSLTELQKHATRVSQENAELKKGTKTVETPPATKVEGSLADALSDGDEADAGEIDAWTQASNELTQSGTITDATRKVLTETLKVPAAVIDSTISAHKAKVQADLQAAHTLVGGTEQFTAITDWAKKNLSKDDLAVVQDQLRGKGWKLALQGLNSMYRSAQVNEPGNLDLKQGGGTGAMPFETQAEMVKAMQDPRYQKQSDMNYVREVQARVYATHKANK